MLWELYQQSKIRDAENSASKAESKSQHVGYAIAELEDKLESLAITCQALWEIAREQSGLTDEQLLEKVSEIDLRDGRADGKMGSGTRACAQCGRTINQRHMRCLYCGQQVEKTHVFEP